MPDFQTAVKKLQSEEKFHINLGLERIAAILELFGNPQKDLKVIHTAGTNGKGSVCSMLAGILANNGYKTGLYTSPHLLSYTERFKINGVEVEEQVFTQYFELVENTARENALELTEFEILTVIAFLYFKEQKTDIVILETGLGGRLDATNIVQNPLLTIITDISSDHQDRLGAAIGEIAFEKGGILKQNTPLIISSDNKGYSVISGVAQAKKAAILDIRERFLLTDPETNEFSSGINTYKLSLKGAFQARNLELVICGVDYLRAAGFKIRQDKLVEALQTVFWKCRMQYLEEFNLLIDGAHNEDAAQRLIESLNVYFKGLKRVWLFGILDTKDYQNVVTKLFSQEDEIYLTDDFAPNAVKSDRLASAIKQFFPKAEINTIKTAQITEFVRLTAKNSLKIAAGSFYLCSKVLQTIRAD
ncbi:MAG: bifunctional folylpolyglutamate synthase/dihydrofolate synthase [Candidatus Gastranaerophilales bacterium]|nr:bifunctional folylpolyglutamate synthase/dihydrofolate synthase [Candidatus Gastranaerophilales bacterium]